MLGAGAGAFISLSGHSSSVWKIPAGISSVVISTLVSAFFGCSGMCRAFSFPTFL